MEMAVRSMEMAETAMETMETALGALPHPDRVTEQRLLAPEICLRWRQSCGTLSGKLIGCLGFSRRGVFIGKGAASGVDQGGLTHRGRRPGAGRAALWCG
jgi:hypothetical protein